MITHLYVTTIFFRALTPYSPWCSLLRYGGGMARSGSRRLPRPLRPLAMAVFAQLASAAALPAMHSAGSRRSVAAAALHRPGCCRRHAAAGSRRCIADPSSSRCSAASGGTRSHHSARRWRRIAPLLTCSPGGSKTPSPAPQRMKMSSPNAAATRQAHRPAPTLGLGHAGSTLVSLLCPASTVHDARTRTTPDKGAKLGL